MYYTDIEIAADRWEQEQEWRKEVNDWLEAEYEMASEMQEVAWEETIAALDKEVQ